MASSFSLTSESYEGRYLKLSCTQTKNIANNTSTIKWMLTSTGGSSNYYSIGPTTIKINGATVYEKGRVDWNEYAFPAKTGSTNGTTTVYHNSTGSKSIEVSLTTAVYVYEKTTKSGTWTLDSIPRQATITAADNFNDEGNPKITYSNPAGSAVTSLQACISLDGSKADIAYRDISKSATSYTFNLTDAERNVLRSACTASNSRTVYFYIKTVIGGTTLKSKVAKTLSIVNAAPTFTSSQLSYADTNTAVTAITNNPLMIVQNKSNLKVTYTKATAKKSATISKYTFTLNGVTKTSTAAGGTVDFGKVNSDKDLTLSVTVTDSRGNTAKATKTIKCYKYYSPSFVDFKAYRANQNGAIDLNGTWLKCEYITNIASVNGTNARTINITGVGSESIPASADSILIDLNGDKDSTYQVQAVVTDSFGGTAKSVVNTVFGDSRIINVSPDGTGVAIGKKAQESNCLESRYKIWAQDGIYLTNTSGKYPAVMSATDDLWIGATGRSGTHNENGGTYISSGKNENIYVSKKNGNERTNYKILDAENYVDFVSPKPVVLYDPETATSGDVTLTDSAANYSYLEIFYRNSQTYSGGYLRNSVKISNPNNRIVVASITEPDVANMRIRVKTSYYLIEDTKIKKENSLYVSIKEGETKVYKDGTSADTTPSKHILIYKVLGYK